ncbi:MAG TPA: DUF429 domain-containing protein [Methyloceanibacter sp.]|nr:DUF429 domain-containing protein [Methyloceanibacter sp.]
MKVFGLDGYKHGWVAVWIEGGEGGICFFKSINALLSHPHARAMIDIPIGLPECGNRACDLEARRMLEKNRNRVFTGARRGLLTFEKYEQANLWGRQHGAGVSRQLFSLIPKIAQVDGFIDAQRQATLRETHPELVFLRLNRGCSLPSKKLREGIEVRRRLIRREGISGVDDWMDRQRFGTGAKADDVLDACAAAVAARDWTHRVPKEPKTDARGLKMEIWY